MCLLNYYDDSVMSKSTNVQREARYYIESGFYLNIGNKTMKMSDCFHVNTITYEIMSKVFCNGDQAKS